MTNTFTAPSSWRELGVVAPEQLVEARLQLHWAAQVVAAFGETLAEKQADFSHTSSEWRPAHSSFVSNEAPEFGNCRAALRPHDLCLMLLNSEGRGEFACSLREQTLPQALTWLRDTVKRYSGKEVPALRRPDYEMPVHGIATGAKFELNRPALRELQHWYENTHDLLSPFARVEPQASPVRIWPHHFDIATLVLLEAGDPEKVPQMGLGMTPGDGTYPEPYFYVTPWPHGESPKTEDLPSGAVWRKSWFGAVLTGQAVVSHAGAASQAQAVAAYLNAATVQGRKIINTAKV